MKTHCEGCKNTFVLAGGARALTLQKIKGRKLVLWHRVYICWECNQKICKMLGLKL